MPRAIKRCSHCKTEKPIDAFRKLPNRKDGLDYYCKECRREYDRGRERKNNPEVNRRAHLRYYYGIEVEQFDAMRAAQNYRCAICKRHEDELTIPKGRVNKLVVDHDHETGAVRALLCNGCNSAIGYFDDDADRLEAAIAYLAAHGKPIYLAA